MKVQNHTVVTMEYTLRLDNGEIVDSTAEAGPFQYVHGTGSIVPGLEAGLTGMEPGETRQITVEPEDGYGQYTSGASIEVPLDLFPPDMTPEVGMGVYLESPSGEMVPFFITELGKETAVLDANHPLAGERLHFEVTVLDVRQATPEEIEHRHAHSG